MNKIPSFNVNHLILLPGLYVSRRDVKDDVWVTTFDIRMIAPNIEPAIDPPAAHTIEHIGATFLRNSMCSEDVIYFGPMGCRTGFYLVMFGDLESVQVYDLVKDMVKYIVDYDGDIPGASPKECGNWCSQDLQMARYYCARYLADLVKNRRFLYE